MEHRTGPVVSKRRVVTRVSAACLLALAAILPGAGHVLAADVTMTAEPMLDGNVRPGAWSGVWVHLENSGPAVDGELRIGSSQQGGTTYGVAVHLATGARQDHTLYAQPGFFGARFTVTLVSGDATLASEQVAVTSRDAYSPSVYLVAERPEGVITDLRSASTSMQSSDVAVLAISPEDLPPRVEAWAAIDRLVWQDVDSSRLSSEQMAALHTWISAGGRLVIVGGSTGSTTLGAFPDEILPFRPSQTVDATADDLAALVGDVPSGTASVPALAGTLDRGTVMARSGDHVIAAMSRYGTGHVTLLGIDPSASWLAGSDAAEDLWRRVMPPFSGQVINPLVVADDGTFVARLNDLPAVQLPSIEQLFLLLFAYIALIGPVNYLVLRRLDRREWAWVTMPALVAVFAVAAYGMGLGLKGTDVIVNELAIVRGAAGSDRAMGQVYIGVFSPARATFDVRVGGSALLSNPVSLQQQGNAEQPIDVLIGDPSQLRGYQVGFGVLRGFRAEASVAAPSLDVELVLEGSRLQGTLTNRSDMALEHVAVVYGGGLQMLGGLAAGEARTIDVEVGDRAASLTSLSERMFPSVPGADRETVRKLSTRRTVIDQLTGWSGKLSTPVASESPVILAWRPGGALEVELGVEAHTVGDALYILPAQATISGRVAFPDDLIARTIVATDAVDGFQEGTGFSLGPGSMTLELRPPVESGTFEVAELELAMTQGQLRGLTGDGTVVSPLPDDQQPDPEDPLAVPGGDPGGGGVFVGGGDEPASGPVPEPVDEAPPREGPEAFDGLPEIQLFDRQAGRWLEFEHFEANGAYVIADPQRYVDGSGAVLARFVNRHDLDFGGVYFTLVVRMEGTVT